MFLPVGDSTLETYDPFRYLQGELWCEDVAATSIAEQYGTPTYVYSAACLRSRYEQIRDAFAPWDALVCFSVKSCGNLSILGLLARAGSGFDVVSGGELYRVLSAGGDPGKVVYAGVGKTADEISYALGAPILMFDVESRGELHRINRVACSMGVVARVAIRVNPDVDARTHAKTTTGKGGTKFGIGVREAEILARDAQAWPGVDVAGIHVHLGSPIYDTTPYEDALEKVLGLIGRLREAGCEIGYINVGGGFCISYTGEPVIGPGRYADAIRSYLEKSGCAVIIEPGRYIAGKSGLLLSRVVYRKESEFGKTFAVCDAGMNDLIRPTLYEAFHRIWPVCSAAGMPAVLRPGEEDLPGFATEVVDVVGPVCETGDYLGLGRALPRLEAGDLLAVFDAGAYGFTMSSNYNGRPRAAEVLVDGADCRLIRRRETYEDMLQCEKDLL
jgi:diaminopimelate decarboxylase